LSSEIRAATLQTPSLHSPYSVEQSEAERQDFFLSFHWSFGRRSDIWFSIRLGTVNQNNIPNTMLFALR
jgi:hypothetical protein